MSTHWGNNILFRMSYGANKFGITLATPGDMMHACESGIIKYMNKVFVGSMSLSVQVKMDLLVEKLLWAIVSMPECHFQEPTSLVVSCSLTMLSLHHWPGMTTAFLVALLTEEGCLCMQGLLCIQTR
jgi:hypothetical protein